MQVFPLMFQSAVRNKSFKDGLEAGPNPRTDPFEPETLAASRMAPVLSMPWLARTA